jgi:GDP-mannose 6-dehydrogenase
VNPREVKLLAAGRSPVIEPGLDDLIDEGVRCGRPLATSSSTDAVRDSEAWIICVGTSSGDDDSAVIVRSTVLPGTVHERMNPNLEESSGKVADLDFGVCMVPEFLREGCAAQDYYKPSTVVIDELDPRSGGVAQQLFQAAGIPLVRTTIESAEMTKCASNAFHALKVLFANEAANLAKAHSIDGREVMDILCLDR